MSAADELAALREQNAQLQALVQALENLLTGMGYEPENLAALRAAIQQRQVQS